MNQTHTGNLAPRVGIVGQGFMGSAISLNLIREHVSVTGYDIAMDRIDLLVENGGTAASSCRDVADNSEIVILSLPSSAALEDVVRGKDGILSSNRRGLILMECSTLPVEDKETAHSVLKETGKLLLDCPISGGANAAKKDLVVFGSGDRAAFETCIPIIDAFARAHYYLGVFGNGSKMKFVANLLVTIHNVSTAEAMVFGMKAGLDPEMIYKVIGDSSGRSRMFEVRGPKMVKGEYDPSMTLELFMKDIKIIGGYASTINCPTPLFSECAQLYTAALAQGLNQQDSASICTVLERLARLERK